MGYAIPIKNIGSYVIKQLTQVIDAITEAPDGGPPLILRGAEITVAFATADGLPITPSQVVVGETPIPVDEAQRRLEALDRKVFVASGDVSKASAATRGTLVLRLVFPTPTNLEAN